MIPMPSAADLKARYPEFAPVSDVIVEAVLLEASGMVDEGWIETDQKPGIVALAAHFLSMEGWPRRASGGGADPGPINGGREVVMRKVGDVTTQFASGSGSGSSSGGDATSDYLLTAYGRSFLRLLKLNSILIGLV